MLRIIDFANVCVDVGNHFLLYLFTSLFGKLLMIIVKVNGHLWVVTCSGSSQFNSKVYFSVELIFLMVFMCWTI